VERRKSVGKGCAELVVVLTMTYFTQLDVKPELHAVLSSWIKTVLKGQRREFELLVLFLLGLFLHFSYAPLFLRGSHIWVTRIEGGKNLRRKTALSRGPRYSEVSFWEPILVIYEHTIR
jgi:hypothetical protein